MVLLRPGSPIHIFLETTKFLFLIPLLTVVVGRSTFTLQNAREFLYVTSNDLDVGGNDYWGQGGITSSNGYRFKRDVETPQVEPKYSRKVALFGVALELDKGHGIKDGVVHVMEDIEVTLRVFGRFINNTKIRFSKNGHACYDDANPQEYEIVLEVEPNLSPGKEPGANPDFTYSVGTVQKVRIPKRADYPQAFFCIFNPQENQWLPQGTSKFVHIHLTSPFMPLWAQVVLIVNLLMLSGLFSGLNLGLMSLNKTDLKIIMNTGTPTEKLYAAKIAPVRNHGNFLLCCLLFSNVLVNASLTILMDDVTSGVFAIIFSTLAIVIFGEIIPQAICSRHGLAVGAKTIYITKFFMIITSPLAWPLSKLLDRLLGEEIGSVYTRERLKELLKVTKDHHGLETEEVALISGALDMKTKTVRDIMTRIDAVFMLPLDATLDYETVAEIEFQGYTRIPVYERTKTNVVAVLNVKQLTLLDASDNIPIRTVVEYYQNSLFYIFENTRLDYMFRAFREGSRGHMAFVQRVNDEGPGDPYYETMGVVTMEDVLEELLQADIMDETDVGKYKSRLEHRERPKSVPFLAQKKARTVISIPPPLALAACQFLTTAVPAFNRNLISEGILDRLIKSSVTVAKPPKLRGHETPKYIYLYENGKPADYFMMILEGRVTVEVGKERIEFPGGPFQFFGADFLINALQAEANAEAAATSPTSPKDKDSAGGAGTEFVRSKLTFSPDYTVRVMQECFYMKIKYTTYRAAKVATELERKYISDPKASKDRDWETEVEKILTSGDEEGGFVKQTGRRMVCDSVDGAVGAGDATAGEMSDDDVEPRLLNNNPGTVINGGSGSNPIPTRPHNNVSFAPFPPEPEKEALIQKI